MNKKSLSVIVGTSLATQLVATAAVSFVKITDDADSGISSANSYTHAIDFGVNNADTTINGVTFNKYKPSDIGTLNFSAAYSVGAGLDYTQNNHHGVTGQLANLMQDMIFNNGNTNDSTATWTLSGLTAGMTYETRIYTRTWASSAAEREATIVFDHDGAGAVSVSAGRINQDNATESPVGLDNFNDAYYISYTYTAVADEDLVIAATQHASNASWHLYGISNQVASVPEPSSISLLALGGVAVLMRRKK